MKTCNKCLVVKPESDFYVSRGKPRNDCKICNQTVRRRNIISSMLANARVRARSKGIDFDLDKDFLLRLREAQNDQCALTGWTLDWTYVRSGRQRQCPPLRASLDRIDSSRGYTRDNVQLVCDMANRIKNLYPQDEFVKFCQSVASHAKDAI